MKKAPQDWKTVVEAARDIDACLPLVRDVITVADEAMGQPPAKRVFRCDDVGKKGRTSFDGRANNVTGAHREVFALSMSDFTNCNILAREIPPLAAAGKLTGDTRYVERCVAQLEETSAWSPLQRPGWVCYRQDAPLPETDRGYSWLATGLGVRAIATALELLPDGAVSEDLLQRIHSLLQEEVRIIQEDWALKRSWFVASHNCITNQWVLPTEGLIRACLTLGVDSNREAYELGVANMTEALDSHNPEGAFEEGLAYGTFTLDSMAYTVRAMSVAGDNRLAFHPYLGRCTEWMVQYIQPGGYSMNAFDNIMGRKASHPRCLRPCLTLLTACSGNGIGRWALDRLMDGPAPTLPGLAIHVDNIEPVTPPLAKAYHGGGACVMWRNAWEDKATGIWIRGGHADDQHDHSDRGHVNIIFDGIAALMEAGTPFYDNPRMRTHFSSGIGHNVLQVGCISPDEDISDTQSDPPHGWQHKGVTSFKIHRLDNEGGDVVVDASDCYDDGVLWKRRVTWSAESVQVIDSVRLSHPDLLQLRWHLATDENTAVITNMAKDATSASIRWTGFIMKLEASIPVNIRTEILPDATLAVTPEGELSKEHNHPCIAVGPVEPTDVFEMTATLERRQTSTE